MSLAFNVLVSDYLLAVLIPIVLLFLSFYILSSPKDIIPIIFGSSRTKGTTPRYFSVQRAAASYAQYARLASTELKAMRKSYERMRWAHRRIGYDLGYPGKLSRLEESINTNAVVADGIARLARVQFPEEVRGESGFKADLNRVREAMRHFVRDWSDEGRVERETIFGPILQVLDHVPVSKRDAMRVLVPGSGLGRLAWEISQLGFKTTANELSFFMNLALRFLLSEDATQTPNQHTVQPYASWFSHQRTVDTLFRSVAFPDVVPRLNTRFFLSEDDFLTLHAPAETEGYDFVVTLFFIDTSLNIIDTLEQIHSLLRPGGQWINLGPLLWTSGGEAAMELSLEEVMKLMDVVGFDIQSEGSPKTARRRVECEYTADRSAMMKWLYQAEFWVATKRT